MVELSSQFLCILLNKLCWDQPQQLKMFLSPSVLPALLLEVSVVIACRGGDCSLAKPIGLQTS